MPNLSNYELWGKKKLILVGEILSFLIICLSFWKICLSFFGLEFFSLCPKKACLHVYFSGKHFCWIAAVDTLALLELQEPPAAAPRQVDRRFSPGHGCDDPSGGLGVRTNSVDLRLTRPLASVNLSHSLGDLHICH